MRPYGSRTQFPPTASEDENMFRFARVVAASAVIWGASASAEEGLRVRVWNYGRLRAEILSAAEAQVSEVFRRAGARLEWLDCDPYGRRSEECAAPVPDVVILRIMMESPLPGRLGADVLGRAYGESLADVYDSAVRFAAREPGAPLDCVYAMVIAHEFGHVLLGPKAHTGFGLMRPRWEPEDFDAASKHRLNFRRRQCDAIRAALQARRAGVAK
jgi:hypothetical protein